MKRAELQVGQRVARVTKSYGDTRVQECIVLDTQPWEERPWAPFPRRFTRSLGGKYGSRNGVAVAIRYGNTATPAGCTWAPGVAQLGQLRPDFEAERKAKEEAEAAARAAREASWKKHAQDSERCTALSELAREVGVPGYISIFQQGGQVKVSLDTLEALVQAYATLKRESREEVKS